MAEAPIQVPVEIISKQALKSLKNIEAQTKKTASVFTTMKSNVVALNQGFQLASRVIGTAVRVVGDFINKSAELEKGLAEIGTLIDGDAESVANLKEEILELQATFGTSQQDATKAYYQAISSGAVNAATATDLIVTAQKLAIGGITTLTVATDGLTSVINAYGLKADQAVNVSDALFIAMKAGKTTVEELSSTVGQAAPIASNLGVSYSELLASISAITTGGVTTANAVTQVRAAMVALTKPTEDLKAVFKDLNIESIQTAISQDGLVETLNRIIGSTDGSAEAVGRLFSRVEGANAVINLTGKAVGPKFIQIMNDMNKAAGNAGDTTQKAFNIIAKTASQRMKVVEGAIDSGLTKLSDVIVQSVLPSTESLKATLEGIKTVINGLTAAWRFFVEFFQRQSTALTVSILQVQIAYLESKKFLTAWTEESKRSADAQIENLNAIKQAVLDEYNQGVALRAAAAEDKKVKRDEEKVAEEEGMLQTVMTFEEHQAELARIEQEQQDKRAAQRGQFFSDWRNELVFNKKFEELTGEQRVAIQKDALNRIAGLSSSNNKTLAAIGKAAAITTATIDGIVAVQKTFAAVPFPFNFPAAALVGAATAANIAKIAGVELADGGIVLPRPGGVQATIGEAGQAEAVIPLDDDRAQGALGGLGGGNVTVNITGAVVANNEELIAEIVDGINTGVENSNLQLRA